jgi:hypothetical protein
MDADGNPTGWNKLSAHGSDIDGNDGRRVRIRGSSKRMELLKISRHGSSKLRDMERNTNRLISRCNRDTTGKYLKAAFAAVDAVVDQREKEMNSYKENQSKSNEADQKRYSKKKYRKWDTEKEAKEDLAAEEAIDQAKQDAAADAAKEAKFKSQANEGKIANHDTEDKVRSATEKFTQDEEQKAEVAAATDVPADQAIFDSLPTTESHL